MNYFTAAAFDFRAMKTLQRTPMPLGRMPCILPIEKVSQRVIFPGHLASELEPSLREKYFRMRSFLSISPADDH